MKTRLQILEDIYDEIHFHKVQTELAHDSLQPKIITLIDPSAEQMRMNLEEKLLLLKNTMENDDKAMARVKEKIEKEVLT